MKASHVCGGHNRTHGRYEEALRLDSFLLASVLEKEAPCRLLVEWEYEREKYARAMLRYDAGSDKVCVMHSLNGDLRIELLLLSCVTNPYGGRKLYFLCPECGKRVRFLCFTKRGFTCRVCGKLNYRVQQSGREDVLLHQIEKIFHELEVETELMNRWDMTTFCDVERPRYMREKKYIRLLIKLMETQDEYWIIQRKKLRHLV